MISISKSPKRILYTIAVAGSGFLPCAAAFHFEGNSPWLYGACALVLFLCAFALFDFKLSDSFSVFWFLLAPFLTFYCVESLTHNPWEMWIMPQLINAFFYYLVFLFFLMVTGRSRASFFLSTPLFFLMGIANYYTVEFRDSPILPWDLNSVGTALSITDNYQFTVDYRLLYIILCFLGIMIIGEKTVIRIKKAKLRASLSTACLCLTFCLYAALQFPVVTDNVLTFSNLFTQWATYEDNGFVVSFITNMRYMNIEKPEHYDSSLIELSEELLSQYPEEVPANGTYPNIIVVMNEAFSDLSVIHDFQASEDYMPNFRALMEDPDTISGNLYVSVLGGNTANTEFEFLTGDSLAFLPSGSVAYQQYVKDATPSYASLLAGLGYTTISMHPYYASGWDRDRVYPWFGFDTSLFQNDFANPKLIRKYVSDEATYDKMIRLYENNTSGNPLFLFDVTMQNHGGYSQIYESFPIRVHIAGDTVSEAAEHYLTLIQESDRAFQKLIDYFSQADEDTIIVMFGDHQPSDYVAGPITKMTGKSTEEMSLSEQQNRYIVPFVIWANYDLEGKKYDGISANYLSGILSQAAGLPLSPYQAYLAELSQTLPIITGNVIADQKGNFYPVKYPGEYKELLHEYAVLQYNHLFDKDGRISQLFSIK